MSICKKMYCCNERKRKYFIPDDYCEKHKYENIKYCQYEYDVCYCKVKKIFNFLKCKFEYSKYCDKHTDFTRIYNYCVFKNCDSKHCNDMWNMCKKHKKLIQKELYSYRRLNKNIQYLSKYVNINYYILYAPDDRCHSLYCGKKTEYRYCSKHYQSWRLNMYRYHLYNKLVETEKIYIDYVSKIFKNLKRETIKEIIGDYIFNLICSVEIDLRRHHEIKYTLEEEYGNEIFIKVLKGHTDRLSVFENFTDKFWNNFFFNCLIRSEKLNK